MEKLSKNKIEVLNLFRKNVFLSKTIREISLMLKKPYPKIHTAVRELAKENILKIKKVGKSNLCELILNKETITYFAFLDELEAAAKKIPNIDKILNFKEFLDDIIIVTGSYAEGKQKKDSDIDLVLITSKKAFDQQKWLENLTLTFFPKIHPIVFTYKDFISMLLSKEENLGKEVFKKHIIFRNVERFYLLIKEAIENGFKS